MRFSFTLLMASALLVLLGLPEHAWADPGPAPPSTLQDSVMRRKAFPFAPDCAGKTQELVACAWQKRDATDKKLLKQLGGAKLLERWRQVRSQVCQKAAARYAGGSIQPVMAFSCENALNKTLEKQLSQTLGDPAP